MERLQAGALIPQESFLLLTRHRVDADLASVKLCMLVKVPALLDVLVPATEFRSDYPAQPLGCRLYRIQLAVALLHPSGTKMALHCDADMVWAIVGAHQVKFLSGSPGSQGQDAFAEGRRAGFACR